MSFSKSQKEGRVMAVKEKATKKEEKALAPRGGGLVPFEGRMPQVDMFDRETEIVIRVALPGVAKEDLEVSMTDETVTIRASTRREAKEEKGEYYRRELSQGEFQRTLRLPAAVKGAEAKATFKDGI